MNKILKYDFVPQTVSVGIFGENGFVSCKYKYDKWQNVSVFERLCKYKPHEQRDPETELKKAICNAVVVLDNEPTEGFSFVDYCIDLYLVSWHGNSDIVLHDPRGFNVAITVDNFWRLMQSVGLNMKDGVIEKKLAYAWHEKENRFMLVNAETDEFKEVKAKSDEYKAKADNRTYVTKKQLVIGKIYKGSEKFKGLHMYLGEADVYDIAYHKNALSKMAYCDLDEYIENKMYSDITAKNRMIFYRVDKKGKDEGLTGTYPFSYKSSISKLLECEVDEGIENLPMFNDKTKLSTYENVKEYMSRCLLFNKIDLKTLVKGGKDCPEKLFADVVDYAKCNNFDYDVFPFSKLDLFSCAFLADGNNASDYSTYYSSPFQSRRFGQKSYHKKYVRIKTYGGNSFTIEDCKSLSYWSDAYDKFNNISIHELYAKIIPKVATAKLESGKDIQDEIMLMLQGSMQK